jgi:hypothetical protein
VDSASITRIAGVHRSGDLRIEGMLTVGARRIFRFTETPSKGGCWGASAEDLHVPSVPSDAE